MSLREQTGVLAQLLNSDPLIEKAWRHQEMILALELGAMSTEEFKHEIIEQS